MNKKKHQSEPNGDESSESCDENQNNQECIHIGKSLNQKTLKKALIKTGFLTDCEICKKSPDPVDSDMDGFEYDMSLWLCLQCGNQGCGRSKNEHALNHYKTPHSDSHAMCVNTTNWSVWCYDCDAEVNITCRKNLLQTVEFLRKQAESNKIKQQTSDALLVNRVVEVAQTLGLSNNTGASPKLLISSQLPPNGLPRARGLTNLGNTCFFNSVMQCLGQTPYLLQLLEETSNPVQHFSLPGGKLQKDNKEFVEVPPLEGSLETWRPLTQTLAETLRELQSGRSEVYTPRHLLSRLTNRMPQFGGGDQHDAHELLRHLLEAVREEDLKRYKTVILQKLGYSSKTDPSTVSDESKQIIKFYGQQASEMQLATEQVFRGVLVSILQCQECGHTSTRDEFFLDLSLPLSEKQLPPVLRRKAEDTEDNKLSKHQIKKEKRAERRKNKKQKGPRNNSNNVSRASNAGGDENAANSESESDADVEDNVEETPTNSARTETVTHKGLESGYNSDKVDNSSPDSNNRTRSPETQVNDSGVPSPVVGGLSTSPISPDNSPASSETNVDMGSSLGGHNSPNDDLFDEFERPESRLAFASDTKNNADLKVKMATLSLLNDGDSNKVNCFVQDDSMDGACAPAAVEDEKMEEDGCDEEEEEPNSWTGTLAPRGQIEEGKCTVQSCLGQFTECELMVGNNRVTCDLCTKRHGGPEKKSIYKDASKQLLIYNPPAVLILHLKRFQVHRFRSAKVSKNVKFSTILDLAPFCSKKAQALPTFEPGQSRVLYSLYGVVEHSGSIHGGHYVAYVKVRAPLDENSYRWKFLPKNQQRKAEEAPLGARGEPEAPPGRWFYISDSYVSEVQESKVLDAEAYLLFYERIL